MMKRFYYDSCRILMCDKFATERNLDAAYIWKPYKLAYHNRTLSKLVHPEYSCAIFDFSNCKYIKVDKGRYGCLYRSIGLKPWKCMASANDEREFSREFDKIFEDAIPGIKIKSNFSVDDLSIKSYDIENKFMLWSPMSDFQDTAYGGIINFLPTDDDPKGIFEILDYLDQIPNSTCYHGFAESSDDDVYSCTIDNPSRYPLIDVYYYIENRFNDAFNDMYADFDANIVKREGNTFYYTITNVKLPFFIYGDGVTKRILTKQFNEEFHRIVPEYNLKFQFEKATKASMKKDFAGAYWYLDGRPIFDWT